MPRATAFFISLVPFFNMEEFRYDISVFVAELLFCCPYFFLFYKNRRTPPFP